MYEYLLLLAVIFAVIWFLNRRNKYLETIEFRKPVDSIHGLFMNDEKQEASQFFRKQVTEHDDTSISFYRHKQGTSSYLDEEWKKVDDSNVYQISSSESSIMSSKKYGILEGDEIRVYDDEEVSEILYRHKEECYYGETVEPTYENFNELYDLVEVSYTQSDELEKIIRSKKVCATLNDVHIHIGAESNLYMARGMFAIDKKRTCFYYVTRDILPILVYQCDPKPIIVDVKEFEPLGFIGAMN